jgi:GH25 family lysozyme M1 (1,4-beta-N-acetylmuramidase)
MINIDVSDNNHVTDWQALKPYVSSVYVKASQGADFVSHTLSSQYSGACGLGVPVGLYHFADTTMDPGDNACQFVSALKTIRGPVVPGSLPPCLDIETGTGNKDVWVRDFRDTVRELLGVEPFVVYASSSWLHEGLLTENWMDEDTHLWVASWGTPVSYPSYLTDRVVLHQYTSTGRLAGISGAVDESYAIRPIDEWMV